MLSMILDIDRLRKILYDLIHTPSKVASFAHKG